MARVSTLEHWESYWKGHTSDIDDTYSTGGRLVREVLADGPVDGRWVMEIGAGSGRDLLDLGRQAAAIFRPNSVHQIQKKAKMPVIDMYLRRHTALRNIKGGLAPLVPVPLAKKGLPGPDQFDIVEPQRAGTSECKLEPALRCR